jgi:uncharacterized cupredoxin-like copper-binding protein
MKQHSSAIPFSCLSILLATALTLPASLALAHGAEKHAKSTQATSISTEEKAFGRQGDPAKARRTIAIDMLDTMRFMPSNIRVRQGDTIRFVIRNKGKMLHELVLGTMEELKEHGELMKRFPDMEHDEPYMAHVNPGEKEEIVWQFTKAGEFHYACLIPGHFEAGMVGKITVAAK